MEKQRTPDLSLAELNAVLREIAEADDPGAPVRRLGIEMRGLTEPDAPDEKRDRFAPWNPFERCLQRLLTVDYRSAEGAFDGLYALLALLDDMSGPEGTVLSFLGPTGLRRLLVAMVLTVMMQEPDPDAVSLRELLLV